MINNVFTQLFVNVMSRTNNIHTMLCIYTVVHLILPFPPILCCINSIRSSAGFNESGIGCGWKLKN